MDPVPLYQADRLPSYRVRAPTYRLNQPTPTQRANRGLSNPLPVTVLTLEPGPEPSYPASDPGAGDEDDSNPPTVTVASEIGFRPKHFQNLN
jgi:hypothetical protein